MKYDAFFEKATGHAPYPFQERFATADPLPHLLCAPTGAGKTATAVLGWLWRRFDSKLKLVTPRRLVYCLPMRVLVEQSYAESKKWLENLGLRNEVGLHMLMGGAEKAEWYLKPEQPAVLIGTQDMLLSRALNRGYAASRFHWPIDFGYLNNDCLWVFDEPQLMANGVSTSAQLAGLRQTLKAFSGTTSVWMSATLEPTWLDTIDFRGKFTEAPHKLDGKDYDEKRPLYRRMTATKVLAQLTAKTCKGIAKTAVEKHQPGTQTLIVANTVDRAKEIYEELTKLSKKRKELALLLVHSRYRPRERVLLNKALCAKDDSVRDRIIIATQVVEAGVDISSRMLISDLCPWSSMVQRMGRCNRTGDDGPGQVFWVEVSDEKPYEMDAIEFAREQLIKLEGQIVSPRALEMFKEKSGFELPFEHKHVLRRRDLLDLFDTTPDLSGNDIDISRFVRSDDKDTDVQIFWRKWAGDEPDDDLPQPERRELCNVPFKKVIAFLDEKRSGKQFGYIWDFLDGSWSRIDPKLVRPGMTILLHVNTGGYSETMGWDEKSDENVAPIPPEIDEKQNATGSEPDSTLPLPSPLDIQTHTNNVCDMLDKLLNSISLPQYQDNLKKAARWHDLGKGHSSFQSGLRQINPDLTIETLWAKSGTDGKLRFKPKYFRHELVSALVVLKHHADWPFLISYLIAAHHGKVRLGIRSLPEEDMPDDADQLYAQGVRHGDSCPAVTLGSNEVSPDTTVDLSPMRLGGESSWTDRALKLLDELGPFQLAYLEALIRTADVRASRKEAGRE